MVINMKKKSEVPVINRTVRRYNSPQNMNEAVDYRSQSTSHLEDLNYTEPLGLSVFRDGQYTAVHDKKAPINIIQCKSVSERCSFDINYHGNTDTENNAVDVIVRTGDREYSATFVTPKFIEHMFKKNARTGECSSGTYFCIPSMVVVRDVTPETINTTINGLMDELSFSSYFQENRISEPTKERQYILLPPISS